MLAWQRNWTLGTTGHFTKSLFPKVSKGPTILNSEKLSHTEKRVLMRAASGHFPTKQYLTKRKLLEDELCSACGVVENLDHILRNCQHGFDIRFTQAGGVALSDHSLNEIFNSEILLSEAAKVLLEYLKRKNSSHLKQGVPPPLSSDLETVMLDNIN